MGQVLDEHNALGAYFDSLLYEAPEAEGQDHAEETESYQGEGTGQARLEDETPAADTTDTAPSPDMLQRESAAETVVAGESNDQPEGKTTGAADDVAPSANEPHPESAPLEGAEDGPPAVEPEQGIHLQTFSVAGIPLAIAVDRIKAVKPWQGPPSAIEGAPAWLLAIMQDGDKEISIVDVGQLIVPAGHPARATMAGAKHVSNVLLLEDTEWGLAVGDLGEAEVVAEEQVNWREQRPTRPWLAGSLATRNCAVVDTEALLAIVNGEG